VLDAQTLTPDKDAGSYAAAQEIRLLQSLGFKVTFVPANLAYMGGYTEALQRMGVEVLYAPFIMGLAEVIERRGAEFNLIYIARYAVAEAVIDAVRARAPHAKVILNIHDLHFLREIREAVRARDPALMQKAAATRDAELAVMRKVDLVVSYSSVEQAVIESHNMDATRVVLNPWVVDTPQEVPGFEERRDIAFLGGFGHRPNAEGVEWFIKEVMPLLRAQAPGVRFLVYGSHMPESLKSLAGEDVILKGFVKTTEEVYDTARIFVAPLLSGAGLKGKVIGAFARGIPTVMTPIAAEGTGASNGLHAIVESRPADWAQAIARLYNDPGTWQAMSEHCRRLARETHSFARGQEMVQQALHSVGLFPPPRNDALYSRFPVG
jgi:glycosyltransferase involved in cell wall biosynthesis